MGLKYSYLIQDFSAYLSGKIADVKCLINKIHEYQHNLLVFVFFLVLLLFSCNEEDPGYKIHGSIDGIESGDARLLKLDLETNNPVGIDTVEIRNGEFTFSGHVNHLTSTRSL